MLYWLASVKRGHYQQRLYKNVKVQAMREINEWNSLVFPMKNWTNVKMSSNDRADF